MLLDDGEMIHPTFELDSPNNSNHNDTNDHRVVYAQTISDLDNHPEAFDDVEINNVTPKKNQQKHAIRQSNASSPGNMNSYAFMHTYNNLPNNAPRPSPSQANLVGSGDKRSKKPWYSVSSFLFRRD